jgi:dynein assembly factor 3
MTDGSGFHQTWGLSPAQDLLGTLQALGTLSENVLSPHSSGDEHSTSDKPINILLMKPGDVRHVLRTLSALHRLEGASARRPVHFFLYEDDTETLARHLLLLHVFTDWGMPIRQRAHTFLEIFGNILVQDRTAQYTEAAGRRLTELVCDGKGRLADFVDLSFLRHRTRDGLQMVFESWRCDIPFNAASLHEHRLRGLLKERYDARQSIVDGDYFSGIFPNCSVVHRLHYRTWRLGGIAFEFGDQTYTQPNRSLASYVEARHRDGSSKLVRGLWCDIINSPYIAFGIAAEQFDENSKELFRIVNEGTGSAQHRHNAVEVSVHNMLGFMHEIETCRRYQMKEKNCVYSGLGPADDPAHARFVEDKDHPSVRGNASVSVAVGSTKLVGGSGKEADVNSAFSKANGGDVVEAHSIDEEMRAASKPPKKSEERLSRDKAYDRAENIVAAMSHARLHLLSNGSGAGGDTRGQAKRKTTAADCDLWKKARFRGLFDVAVLSSSAAHHIPFLTTALRQGAVVLCETTKHMVPLSKMQKEVYLDNLTRLASDAKLLPTRCSKKGNSCLAELENLIFAYPG